ncbi:PrpF protein [Rhodoblastus sphagnicola]|uniref:PrpF protein n=1 Tax=Rhodoblastus sphagnicola TaxID=333368 RepID=A0A2S6NEB5_9HYPH|nr:4-oxalomesaconate tautomerase [Rhodoblastus sphagnicola]MBB4199856.1 4-oxalomesaconate tautomerase [Rhodoblastus sphagnicola]PPQ32914.1 PrpF protein [Rhodoblastus sphagnicola]
MSSQRAIPCLLMRGGTSKGPFFNASDLPQDIATRDKVLLAAMGSPDRRQIDGLGGAHPLTSKVGIVSKSATPGVDLDFLFAQLQPDKDNVDTTPNCGNMLAAVVPFALETGMIAAQGDTSTFRVLTRNTDMQCDITVETSVGPVNYEGTARIDGAPGTSAPITINFLDTAGSVCSGLLPTGAVGDRIEVAGAGFDPFAIDVTCIDNGMPLVIFRADALGRTGYESVADLNADAELKKRIEALRLIVSKQMGLGDVSAKNYPKMTLIAPPRAGGALTTRSFIPHVCHDAIGVLAAVTVATACVLPGSVCEGVAVMPQGGAPTVSVEHPTGEFSVSLETDPNDPTKVTKAALLRTARLIMRGEVMVPRGLWPQD